MTMKMPPGFPHPVLESQRTFRLLLDAMARPGKVNRLSCLPESVPPLSPAAAAVCLTVLDMDTPLWMDAASVDSSAGQYLRFHTGCPLCRAPETAAFALVTEPSAMPALASFHQGHPEYPDRSTTLIIQVKDLRGDKGVTLSGPGVETVNKLEAPSLPVDFWRQFAEQHRLFPMGVDVILVSGKKLACLPRTVEVEDFNWPM